MSQVGMEWDLKQERGPCFERDLIRLSVNPKTPLTGFSFLPLPHSILLSNFSPFSFPEKILLLPDTLLKLLYSGC